jgi:uncharacterized protein YgiM (DUF1202 family)
VKVWKVVRAIIGIVIVIALGVVVKNWYDDFKSASSIAAYSQSKTDSSTASATATATVTLGVGVAKIEGVNFRVKPATSAKLIRGLKKGEQVTVILKDGQWYQVKDSKGKIGWVTASSDYVSLKK